jgi:WD40 repeat protein
VKSLENQKRFTERRKVNKVVKQTKEFSVAGPCAFAPWREVVRFSSVSQLALAAASWCLGLLATISLFGQIESVATAPQHSVWVSGGRVEGHLALSYSPAGSFSPDGSTLAVVNEDKIVLINLSDASVRRVLRPRLENVSDLQIQSANFISPMRLFVLASGLAKTKEKGAPPRTPELAFQWLIDQDTLFGKLDAVGAGGGFGRPRYFPQIGHLALNKENNFDFWNPNSGRGGRVTIPDLTHRPNLYAVSPDGHWLLLAQIETSATPDPVVVRLSEHKLVDTLAGHQGTVLGIAFSSDSRRVVTACEDGKVRLWSAPDWKLLETLSGHQGPVHWAEFSPNAALVASAGEDKTVRIWSAEAGKLEQTLSESQAPVLTVAFSPNGEYVAASTENAVLVWKRAAR